MVKNDICLGGASKPNSLLFRKCALKNAPIPPMPRMFFITSEKGKIDLTSVFIMPSAK